MRRYLVLFVVGFLATLPYWGCYQDMDDEAVTVLGVERLLSGELPYRDWTTRHTPGTYFACLPIFWLLGSSGLTTRACMAFISSLSGLVCQALGERIAPAPLSYLPWLAWTCSALFEKPQLNHHWFGVLASLASLWSLLLWCQPGGDPRRPYLVGFCSSLSVWFIQSNGATSWLMVALVWVRLRPPGLVKVVATYLSLQLLLWLPWVGLAHQVWANHFGSLGRHMDFNRVAYSWNFLFDLFRGYVTLDWTRPLLNLSAWTYLAHLWIQYGLFYLLILLNLVKAERDPTRIRLALAYGCLAWALTTGYCQAPNYLGYAAPAVWLALTALVPATRTGLAVVLLFGLEISGWLLRCFSLNQVFIYPCSTRAGLYYCSDSREAAELNVLHQFIQQNCPPQSQVLAYPYLARLYTTEQLRNPIPFPLLTPVLFDEADFQVAASRLDRLAVPYIFYRPLSAEAIHAEYPRVGAEEFRHLSERDWALVSHNYVPVWQGQIYQIWRRR